MDENNIGLIAGWGRYPICIAQSLIQQGKKVHCIGLMGHADPILKEICTSYTHCSIGRTGHQIRFFRKHGVSRATMAGKVFKAKLFRRLGWLRVLPDLTCLRYLYKNFVTNSKDRKDDTLLGRFVAMYRDLGVELMPATDFVPELLAQKQLLTQRKQSNFEMNDIQFGWEMAKQMGGLDIGQSIVVKGRCVLAVEAIEGTDECIRRAGQLCPAGGFTVVKVAKPKQDMRFDVPTIGLGTLQTIKQAGGRVLAVEANKTILLDRTEVLEYANKHGMTILALNPQDLQEKSFAA